MKNLETYQSNQIESEDKKSLNGIKPTLNKKKLIIQLF